MSDLTKESIIEARKSMREFKIDLSKYEFVEDVGIFEVDKEGARDE